MDNSWEEYIEKKTGRSKIKRIIVNPETHKLIKSHPNFDERNNVTIEFLLEEKEKSDPLSIKMRNFQEAHKAYEKSMNKGFLVAALIIIFIPIIIFLVH